MLASALQMRDFSANEDVLTPTRYMKASIEVLKLQVVRWQHNVRCESNRHGLDESPLLPACRVGVLEGRKVSGTRKHL